MKTSQLIEAIKKINSLDYADAQKALLSILEKHPAAVMKALKADAVPLFKVVIKNIPEGLLVTAV